MFSGSFTMNEKELLAIIKLSGRYEVITLDDGTFIIIPIPPGAILIEYKSHAESVEHFCSKRD